MSTFDLKPGTVIRYDFLWKDDVDKGLEHGRKDRPCAVVLMSKEDKDGTTMVVVCPITHEPPDAKTGGVEIPLKVARHLNLDDDRMWIKTHEVNPFEYRKNQVPFGVTPAYGDKWMFGELPHPLGAKMHQQVKANSRRHSLRRIERD